MLLCPIEIKPSSSNPCSCFFHLSFATSNPPAGSDLLRFMAILRSKKKKPNSNLISKLLIYMEFTVVLTDQEVEKEKPITLVSPENPTPEETIFLSNIDQTVAFPVETVFFFESADGESSTIDIVERVKKSVSEVLLIPYYFMAGRLSFNHESSRLELVCNNSGVLFGGARSRLRIEELGNVSLPNPTFQHLIHRIDGFKDLPETPLLTIQVTRFECGGFSLGFVTNHSILDGKSAIEMFQNLASICRTSSLEFPILYNDRTCIRARSPPQIKYPHSEYTKPTANHSLSSSFTSPTQPDPTSPLLKLSDRHSFKLFTFTPDMLNKLKNKAISGIQTASFHGHSNVTKCSSFEAIVGHVWRARTKALFEDPSEVSSVLFAVDIRSKMAPPLPNGFIGNAVITASASATVRDLGVKGLCFSVEKVQAAISSVTDDYIRSVVDWLEVYKGVPSTLHGNFYVSAWWKLPFYELDFGYGKQVYGGPIVSGMDEFVLLLSNKCVVGAIDVWMVLDREKMEKFMFHVFDI